VTTIVKVQRVRGPTNVFQITDQENRCRQLSYGLKLEGSKQEGELRAGRPAYYHAEWTGIGWLLGEEAPNQKW
jgi:hypothetical protein